MGDIEQQSQFMFYNSSDGTTHIQVIVRNDSIWVTQKSMSEIFETDISGISRHLDNIFMSKELDEDSNLQKMQIASSSKPVNFYSLDAIISVGYRVNTYKATQFRIWATNTLKEYMIKGFVLDDERLKQGNNLFGKDYFDELLARIREIRASERRFYQKITDLYALSSDYDKNAPVSQEFFATVQNKLHWAITGKTAAELIHAKAGATSPNMGLLTWSNAPDGKVVKTDTHVAKNYLEETYIKELESLVSAYLELAENRAKRRILMKMSGWIKFLNDFLQLSEYPILKNKGKISHAKAVLKADKEYKVFRVQQDKEYISDFDKAVEHIKTHGQLPKSEHIRLEKKITSFDKKLKQVLEFNPKK